MTLTETQKRAGSKYKRDKTKATLVRFYPSEAELYEWLSSQENKMGYIKQLIREDMQSKQR